jgi:hypothetical protein
LAIDKQHIAPWKRPVSNVDSATKDIFKALSVLVHQAFAGDTSKIGKCKRGI